MNQIARMKVFSFLIVMVLGTSLIAGCTSAPTPNTTATPSPTLQGTASTTEPRISVSGFKYDVQQGVDIMFKGTVQGGVNSFTIITYYVCQVGASDCPSPKSLYNTAGFIDKKVVSVNADSSFSSNMSTSALNQGLYVSFLELPTGKYSTFIFKIT